MLKSPSARGIVVAAVAFGMFSFPSAWADDSLVAPKPLPTPKAGPTIAAAKQFCGEPADKAEVLIKRYATDAKLVKVYESRDYIAYADSKTAPTVMYTLTTEKNAAYPAAVCRRTVREGDNLVMKMEIVCDGKTDACGKLSKDFTNMNAVMQAEVDSKINKDGSKK